jgi:hypothetical protein
LQRNRKLRPTAKHRLARGTLFLLVFEKGPVESFGHAKFGVVNALKLR